MLIQRPKIHSMGRVLSREQTLELPYLGRGGRKSSHGLSLEVAYLGCEAHKFSRGMFEKFFGIFACKSN